MAKSQSFEYIVGQAMRRGRRSAYCSIADAANSLHIAEQDLNLYEQGLKPIPPIIMEIMLTLGFMMLRARQTQHEYRRLRHKMRNENLLFEE